jgi:D-alanyl-D-alanine carboxypeptidase (penicillin-binding protein 5/6)
MVPPYAAAGQATKEQVNRFPNGQVDQAPKGQVDRARKAQPGDVAKAGPTPSGVQWPQRGQAALALGDGRAVESPDELPAPIASLAKVMTAYLTLQSYPLSPAEHGFIVTVTAGQAEAGIEGADHGQSVVAVRAGERLTERQLLEALLVPSGDNIAWLLASQVAGSVAGFVADMNAEASALGMDQTMYTDPSGFDPGTVSTAADQLRIFRLAMRFSVFRQIVSMVTVTLPIAGTLTNFDPLIAEGYAGKTGSDVAAGGCLAFFTGLRVGARQLTVAGVVMGQGEGGDTSVLLAVAGEAAEQLVQSVVPTSSVSTSGIPKTTKRGSSRGTRR